MLVTASHVFAGTLGKGLYVYERESGRWFVIEQGLPSANVTALAAGQRISLRRHGQRPGSGAGAEGCIHEEHDAHLFALLLAPALCWAMPAS